MPPPKKKKSGNSYAAFVRKQKPDIRERKINPNMGVGKLRAGIAKKLRGSGRGR